jgi:tyrosyl-tRNA synthetase
VGDADVLKCIRMLTFLPIEEIEAMADWQGEQLNRAKEILAYELTKLVHGDEEAEKAQASARALFGAGTGADAPTVELSDDDFTDGVIDVLTLFAKSGLVASKSEARRAVEQGGATVGGEKVTDVKKTFAKAEFEGGLLLRRGKKNYRNIVLK